MYIHRKDSSQIPILLSDPSAFDTTVFRKADSHTWLDSSPRTSIRVPILLEFYTFHISCQFCRLFSSFLRQSVCMSGIYLSAMWSVGRWRGYHKWSRIYSQKNWYHTSTSMHMLIRWDCLILFSCNCLNMTFHHTHTSQFDHPYLFMFEEHRYDSTSFWRLWSKSLCNTIFTASIPNRLSLTSFLVASHPLSPNNFIPFLNPNWGIVLLACNPSMLPTSVVGSVL